MDIIFSHEHTPVDAAAHDQVYLQSIPEEERKAKFRVLLLAELKNDADAGTLIRWTHELVGSACAFAAAREYEKKQEADGRPDSHATAKEIIAGLAGAEVDKLFETKGLSWLDKEKAKMHAKEEAEKIVTAENY